ncbi:MAG: pyridoxal kinase [Hyphomicrobiaceae bacterium]|nr:pyridoxal kinase [Hyphomicrobiaceae bacterium]
MARILAISSQVARGAIGLSAIVPALQALGHEVVALPTILLSNHPGHTRFAGERVSTDLLARMLDALEANGWLAEIEAVITGYLPSAAHVAFARDAVLKLERSRAGMLYVCDPVLGDVPKGIYIEQAAAEAIRDTLVPEANALTPNCFELGYLLGHDVPTSELALRALEDFDRAALVIAKSLPGAAPDELLNVAAAGGVPLALARVARREGAQHGTGDLMAAIVLAGLIEGREPVDVLALATAVVDQVLAASAGRDELDLAGLPRRLADVTPWPLETTEGAMTGTAWSIDPGLDP